MRRYKIGEFAKKVHLPEKTLRFYDDIGILGPTYRNPHTGYRYYDDLSVQRAIVIKLLRTLHFSISDVRDILDNYKNEKQIQKYLDQKTKELEDMIKKYMEIKNRLQIYGTYEKDVPVQKKPGVEIHYVADQLVASIRYVGRYEDEIDHLLKLAEHVGGFVSGPCLAMNYGRNDKGLLDIEILLPVTKRFNEKGIKTRMLKGGKAITLQHHGPYETISKTYYKLDQYVKDHKLELIGPPREIPIKGFLSIIPRSIKDFVTEVQFLVK